MCVCLLVKERDRSVKKLNRSYGNTVMVVNGFEVQRYMTVDYSDTSTLCVLNWPTGFTQTLLASWHWVLCILVCIGHVPQETDAAHRYAADVLWPDQDAGHRRLVQWHQPSDDEETAQHSVSHRSVWPHFCFIHSLLIVAC